MAQYADLIWDRDENARQKFIKNLSPIVLFTYNRLDHTQKTVAALQDNIYAAESELFIYSDAAKNEAAKQSVNDVRIFLHKIKGFKAVYIIERESNWGLARNIIDGVTEIVNKYGKIIVLEDDIVTSKYFLKYMNDALEIYKNQDQVMEISGYMYPIKKNDLPETFFLHFADCWGWATWQRSWCFFERNPQKLIESFSQKNIKKFNLDGAFDFWQQVQDNVTGRLYTWAIFWQAVIFQQNGYMLAAKDSLVQNIGLDNSGEHCGQDSGYLGLNIISHAVEQFPLHIEENVQGRKIISSFFRALQPVVWKRLIYKIKKMLYI